MTTRYKHLTYYDRHTLGKLRKSGHGVREMARIMGFAPSTISRELRRNPCGFTRYSCHKAQDNTKARRREANRRRAKLGKMHFEFIRQQMELTLSPEQIASLFPAKFKFTISPKAIYNYINQWGRHWSDLGKLLRRKSKIYRTKWRYNRGEKAAPVTRISSRPTEINNRRTYGHWEMDLMEGLKSDTHSLLVFVERKSRYSVACLVPNGRGETVRKAAVEALKDFKVLSVTTDNGAEFRQHTEFAADLGAKIYYCYPYRSWEKGAVENNIGLYRDFFPKKQSLPNCPERVANARNLINNRPKKVCGFRTPKSFLEKILNYQI